MKLSRLFVNALVMTVVGGIAAAQTGGNFAIKDSTVDGTAHVSSGGAFAVEVRLGQGLAGPSVSGGNFAVGGGFFPPPPTEPPPPPLTAPLAPADLAAVAVSTSLVTLSWTDSSDNEDGFILERCTVVGKRCRETIVIATLGANAISFEDSGVVKNTSYQYQLRAFNAAGESPLSNVATVKTPRR